MSMMLHVLISTKLICDYNSIILGNNHNQFENLQFDACKDGHQPLTTVQNLQLLDDCEAKRKSTILIELFNFA